jgi:DNA polymerase-1
MDHLYILDGYGLIYRSYFAFGGKPITNNEGLPVGAIMGFYKSLFAVIREQNIAHLVVALDGPGGNFRTELFADYKATRQKTPDDLHPQTTLIEEIMKALGLHTLRTIGFEADDIIATLARDRSGAGLKTTILSADKDLMQLVDPHTQMLRPTNGGGWEFYDTLKVQEKMGVLPAQINDYLALVGDASDNIPGVLGIGPKGAVKLLNTYPSLAEIYNHLGRISPAGVQKKLGEHRDSALLSQKLVALAHVPNLPINPELCAITTLNYAQGAQLFEQHGLTQLATLCRKNTNPLLTLAGSNTPEESKTLELIQAEASPVHYTLITTQEAFNAFCTELAKQAIFAFDTETTGLDPLTSQLVGISFSWQAHHAFYIPMLAPIDNEVLSQQTVIATLKPLMENSDAQIVGQNIKFDYKVMKCHGIHLRPSFDTMLAAWLLDSDSPVNMDFLAKRYLGHTTVSFKDLVPKGLTIDQVDLDKVSFYACEDADITWRLYEHLNPKLEKAGLNTLFNTLEMPLVTILADMENIGIAVEAAQLTRFGQALRTQLNELENEIHQRSGTEFNIQSPKQVGEVLFDMLGYPNPKKGSTNVTVLEELALLRGDVGVLPQRLLKYRTLSKLNSTYAEALLKQIDDHGRIHTNFLQTGTASGRLSSNNPNLQNIPIRESLGRRIREAFVSRPDHLFISADYSQIELVILASLADDPIMLEVFTQGYDLHQETAAFIYNCPPETVTPEQRRLAKTINFGVVYGMSAFRLSNELRIPRAQAATYIEAYFTRYRGVKEFMNQTIIQAQKEQGVRTILNRFRPLPLINSSNHTERSGAERMAVNTVVQGSAADIVKTAMISIHQALQTAGMRTQLLLQVHDELILEAPIAECELAAELLKKSMLNAGLTMPTPVLLKINLETGKHWGKFH